ncbi:uncharacterized protein [Periplaneta americana]|uniref:uncharacterized protein isoform X2 n=1 Tax=Periplaneta americana TaxID=6978 RepID=UPI0037E838B8
MDVIKLEPATLDQLGLQLHDNTYEMSGNKALSQEGNLSHLKETGMKIECVDQSYDIKSEIKVEDITPEAIDFPVVKPEVEIKIEDTTPLPISFAMVKSEVDDFTITTNSSMHTKL